MSKICYLHSLLFTIFLFVSLFFVQKENLKEMEILESTLPIFSRPIVFKKEDLNSLGGEK